MFRTARFQQYRDKMVSDVVEMVAFSEEVRQIRRDGVDKMLDFVVVLAFQQIAVITKLTETEGLKAFSQATVDQITLMIG